MNNRLDPESVDLVVVRALLERNCGPFVEGQVVGRTRLRDEVALQLSCSLMEAEGLVDTMIGRRLIREESLPDGRLGWDLSTHWAAGLSEPRGTRAPLDAASVAPLELKRVEMLLR